MKRKETYLRFQEGYYRPVSLPNWKWIIVYSLWIISLFGYIVAMLGNLWFLILGIIFQSIAMSLPIKWDTGSWRKTEKGKLYIDQYEQE